MRRPPRSARRPAAVAARGGRRRRGGRRPRPAGSRSRLAEGGVGEPGVGVLEPLGGVLGGAGGVGGVREQRGPPLQLRGPRGDAVQGAPRPGQFLLQAGLFPVQPLPVPDPGGGPHGGLLPGGDAPFLLVPGLAQPFPRGVQLGGATAGLLVLLLQLLYFVGELLGGCITGLGGGRRQRLPYVAQQPFVRGALFVGALVGGQGLFLGLAVDVPGVLAGGGGVFGGTADGAGLAVGEVDGQFGGDAGQALFLEVEPVLLGPQHPLLCVPGPEDGLVGVLGEPVAPPGRRQPLPRGLAPYGELFGEGGGMLRGIHPGLETGTGLLPAVEPVLRLPQDVRVGALLAVQTGAFVEEFDHPALGTASRVQPAQFFGGPACGRRESRSARVGETLGQQGSRAGLGGSGPPVFGVGGLPQVQGGRDLLGLAGPLHARLRLPVRLGTLLQARHPFPRLGEPPLEPGEFAYVVERAVEA